MMRVMMSAAGSAVAPGIIRHLQGLGHFVVGHDSEPRGAGARFCNEFHTSPVVDEGWQYNHFLRSMTYDLYLPFLDEELRLFANPTYGVPDKTLCSPVGTLREFCSKVRQHALLEMEGLPVPPPTYSGLIIIKPDHGRGGKNVFRCRARDGLGFIERDDFVVQRFIHGREFTIDALCDLDGKLIYAMPRERVQASGVSTIGRIAMDDALIELAHEVTEIFRFAGPINIQVIRDESGRDFIIEVNPRLSGSCLFSVAAGFDILDASVRLAKLLPLPRFAPRDGLIVRRYYAQEEVAP